MHQRAADQQDDAGDRDRQRQPVQRLGQLGAAVDEEAECGRAGKGGHADEDEEPAQHPVVPGRPHREAAQHDPHCRGLAGRRQHAERGREQRRRSGGAQQVRAEQQRQGRGEDGEHEQTVAHRAGVAERRADQRPAGAARQPAEAAECRERRRDLEHARVQVARQAGQDQEVQGTSSMPIRSRPRLVVCSFQWLSV